MTMLASVRDLNHSRLRQSSLNLPLKLCVVFFQGLARSDQCRLDTLIYDPSQERARDELGSIVGPRMERCAALTNQTRQLLDHANWSAVQSP